MQTKSIVYQLLMYKIKTKNFVTIESVKYCLRRYTPKDPRLRSENSNNNCGELTGGCDYIFINNNQNNINTATNNTNGYIHSN